MKRFVLASVLILCTSVVFGIETEDLHGSSGSTQYEEAHLDGSSYIYTFTDEQESFYKLGNIREIIPDSDTYQKLYFRYYILSDVLFMQVLNREKRCIETQELIEEERIEKTLRDEVRLRTVNGVEVLLIGGNVLKKLN